jgi:hypothetical protein
MGEYQEASMREPILDRGKYLPVKLIRHHQDGRIRRPGSGSCFHDPKSVRFRGRPAPASWIQPYDDVAAAVSQIERMRAPLASIADHSDCPLPYGVQIALVVNLGCT